MAVSALSEDSGRRDLRLEGLWPHKGHLVLKFAGIDSISAAEMLIGCELQVERKQRAELAPGWIYISDLIGCTVVDGDREIGTVRDVQFGAGEAPLLLIEGAGREHEIPFAEAYVKSIEPEQKKIRMALPEGLLDLAAPLTVEEKQAQKRGG